MKTRGTEEHPLPVPVLCPAFRAGSLRAATANRLPGLSFRSPASASSCLSSGSLRVSSHSGPEPAGEDLLVGLTRTDPSDPSSSAPRALVPIGYHGSDLTVFTPHQPQDETPSACPRILAVGRLVPKKGFDDLLRAARLLRERLSSFEVVLIGDGVERPALEALAKDLNLKDRVRFLGSLSPAQVREEYKRADLVVMPSVLLDNGDRDGIPNVLVEAMAMKIPVVSTSISGITP